MCTTRIKHLARAHMLMHADLIPDTVVLSAVQSTVQREGSSFIIDAFPPPQVEQSFTNPPGKQQSARSLEMIIIYVCSCSNGELTRLLSDIII